MMNMRTKLPGWMTKVTITWMLQCAARVSDNRRELAMLLCVTLFFLFILFLLLSWLVFMSIFFSKAKKWSAFMALPIGASLFTIYYAPLPNEKLESQRLPFSARYRFFCSQWISRQSDTLSRARHIEKAYESILESGLGAISREATQTLVYLAQLLTECQDNTIPKEAYEEVFHILVMKPHVGKSWNEMHVRPWVLNPFDTGWHVYIYWLVELSVC